MIQYMQEFSKIPSISFFGLKQKTKATKVLSERILPMDFRDKLRVKKLFYLASF